MRRRFGRAIARRGRGGRAIRSDGRPRGECGSAGCTQRTRWSHPREATRRGRWCSDHVILGDEQKERHRRKGASESWGSPGEGFEAGLQQRRGGGLTVMEGRSPPPCIPDYGEDLQTSRSVVAIGQGDTSA